MTLKHAVHHLLLCLVIALSACSPSPKLSLLAPDATILAFGDSLTHGTGAKESQSYPAVLERLSGHQVINAGVPGEISTDGLTRLPKLLDETQPALLLICHGGNDMLRKMDLNRTAQNLRAMIHLAQKRGIQVVLIGVPRPGIFLGTAEFYEKVASDLNVPLEDQALADILGQRQLKADHVHPNAAGYRALAKAVFRLLQDHGAL